MDMSLWDIIQHGGIAMYIIIGASVLALAVAIERMVALWALRQEGKLLTQTVVRVLGKGALPEARAACERSRSPLAEVFLVGFERLGRTSRDKLIGAVDRERQRLNLSFKNRMWILGTIGVLSPFVGLYGTIIGIMDAFNSISSSGNVSITVVGKPIAEALVATAAGILVAIEALVAYNFFQQYLGRVATEFKLNIEEFLEELPLDAKSALADADAKAEK